MINTFGAGRLTAAPQLKTTPNGTTVCEFTVACDSGPKRTTFIQIVTFGKTADAQYEYLEKGQLITFTGTLTGGDRWENGDRSGFARHRVLADSIVWGQKAKEPVEPNPDTDAETDAVPVTDGVADELEELATSGF